LEHQRELASRRLRLRQGRKRDPEQAHPFSRWQERFEQAKAQTLKVRETVDGVAEGLASGDLLKVGELHLQRQSPPPDAGRLAMPPNLGDDGLQRFAHRREFVQILREGVTNTMIPCARMNSTNQENEIKWMYRAACRFSTVHRLTILAYEMNGAPVSVLHGAPLRLRCENELGFKMVKWIAAIEFVHDFADLGAGQGGYNEDHEFYGYRMPI
jgi:Oxidoreductase molybdopterin binding domain